MLYYIILQVLDFSLQVTLLNSDHFYVQQPFRNIFRMTFRERSAKIRIFSQKIKNRKVKT